MDRTVIALGARLSRCGNVRTLGVRPNFSDYSEEEANLIRGADKIYHPGSSYAAVFSAMGKPCFPSPHCYAFAQDKILQTGLFQALGVPFPRTRLYFGDGQKKNIPRDFAYPFIAKLPRGSGQGRGVYFIRDKAELDAYCMKTHAALIQERIPLDRDIRVLVIGGEVACAYWRTGTGDDFRTNLARGGAVDPENVPRAALDLARDTARACGFDDVGMDVVMTDSGPLVLEANMKYGIKGLKEAGLDYYALMEGLIRDGGI